MTASSQSKKICYLVISHGIWVDKMAHYFDCLEKAKRRIPSDHFLTLSDDARKELFVYQLEHPYQRPGYCAISAFHSGKQNIMSESKIETMKSIFKRYWAHAKQVVAPKNPKARLEDDFETWKKSLAPKVRLARRIRKAEAKKKAKAEMEAKAKGMELPVKKDEDKPSKLLVV